MTPETFDDCRRQLAQLDLQVADLRGQMSTASRRMDLMDRIIEQSIGSHQDIKEQLHTVEQMLLGHFEKENGFFQTLAATSRQESRDDWRSFVANLIQWLLLLVTAGGVLYGILK